MEQDLCKEDLDKQVRICSGSRWRQQKSCRSKRPAEWAEAARIVGAGPGQARGAGFIFSDASAVYLSATTLILGLANFFELR